MCPNDAAELTSAFFMYMFYLFSLFFNEYIFLIFIGKNKEKSSFFKFYQKIHIQMCPNDAAELKSAFFMYMFHIFFYFSGKKKSVNFAHVLLAYVCGPKELITPNA